MEVCFEEKEKKTRSGVDSQDEPRLRNRNMREHMHGLRKQITEAA